MVGFEGSGVRGLSGSAVLEGCLPDRQVVGVKIGGFGEWGKGELRGKPLRTARTGIPVYPARCNWPFNIHFTNKMFLFHCWCFF